MTEISDSFDAILLSMAPENVEISDAMDKRGMCAYDSIIKHK